MKKIYTIAAALLITVGVWAQAPEKMSYQTVVRDATNTLVTAQTVGMQISILQGSAIGTAVYVETHTPNTNANGLASLEIGTGTVVSGDFITIDWATDIYFIKTETDPAGGSTYTITGTSQLVSVPYALHAKTAENVTGSITETDPVFGASIAKDITAADMANWNTHTVDTDTNLDAAGITALGFTSGAHTVDTDTHIDAAGVTALGFASGAHTVDTDTNLDAAGITALGFTSGAHTVDTDTNLDAAGITALGFTSGAHTVDTDTTLDAAGVTALGFASGAHTVDTTLDAAGVTALGFASGAHTVDTTLDAAGVTALGFTSGAHTVDTDTQLNEAAVDAFVANNGYTSYNIGEIKQTIGTLPTGWIKLEGQAISTLTASQQTQASSLGLSGNLPNASNSVLVQNGNALGSVSGSNTKTISQANLPNINLTGSGTLATPHFFGSDISAGSSAFGTTATTTVVINRPINVSVSLGGNGTALDITPQSLSVHTYIYLGQ